MLISLTPGFVWFNINNNSNTSNGYFERLTAQALSAYTFTEKGGGGGGVRK